ncbi:hypothetical protein LTR27_001293 [Elasticomyces elasticus]|nr:hypothetical protein LTR27_001293 [Elasticomyces elasticus]
MGLAQALRRVQGQHLIFRTSSTACRSKSTVSREVIDSVETDGDLGVTRKNAGINGPAYVHLPTRKATQRSTRVFEDAGDHEPKDVMPILVIGQCVDVLSRFRTAIRYDAVPAMVARSDEASCELPPLLPALLCKDGIPGSTALVVVLVMEDVATMLVVVLVENVDAVKDVAVDTNDDEVDRLSGGSQPSML